MCSRINKIIIGLTTWMNKCVVSVQIEIKCISMEGKIMGFFWRKECVGTPQRLLGNSMALNKGDLVGCLSISTCIFFYLHV